MRIPNDTGGDWRLRKFVKYAYAFPPADQKFIASWGEESNLTQEQAVQLAFLMALVYSELTAVLLAEVWDGTAQTIPELAHPANRERLIFGTAKKYNRCKNQFADTLTDWVRLTQGKPGDWYKETTSNKAPREAYDKLLTETQRMRHWARFSADLFNEMIMVFNANKRVAPAIASDQSLDLYHGANLTSGLFNLLYEDERADEFDRTGTLTEEENSRLLAFLPRIQDVYEEENGVREHLPLFITKLCSFRNMFKGKRGGGYHHYRQLRHLRQYEQKMPEHEGLWRKCYQVRAKAYPAHLRGEHWGLEDAPKNLTKWWLKSGWIGTEPEAQHEIKREAFLRTLNQNKWNTRR